MLRLALAACLLPAPVAAQGFADFVSQDSYLCGDLVLPVVTVARDPGRPWLVVLPWDEMLLTLENKGDPEAPFFQEPDAPYGYDWTPTDTGAELGFIESEGAPRRTELTCTLQTGEGGA